jgi:hypothetical protein
MGKGIAITKHVTLLSGRCDQKLGLSLLTILLILTMPGWSLCQASTLIFHGTSPPFANSSGSLFLSDDLVDGRVFSWQSSDMVLGEIESDCTASKWNYFPGNPARLVFVGSGGGATFYGNVLFEPYDRAVVDIVKGNQRIRYTLSGIQVTVVWVNDSLQEADLLPILSDEDIQPFNHDPGTPGGPGGFGGPPTGSGLTALADPFKIEVLHVSHGDDVGPTEMSLTLISNVSSFEQHVILTETAQGSHIFVDEDDSLAIQIMKDSSHDPDKVDRMELFVASVTFGARRTMAVFETGEDTETYASAHLELEITMAGLPDPSSIDVISATLSSDLESEVVSDTLTETAPNTLIFENHDKTLQIAIDRITGNGYAARDDLTAFVTSDRLNIKDAEIDAMETGSDTLDFRTAALHNEGNRGVARGALRGLAIGDRWVPTLRFKNEERWPFQKNKVRVAVRRKRGADLSEPSRVYWLEWTKATFVISGEFRYHHLLKGDGSRVEFFLVEDKTGNDLVFVRNGGNIDAHVQGGDRLIASPWEMANPADEVGVFGLQFELGANTVLGEAILGNLENVEEGLKLAEGMRQQTEEIEAFVKGTTDWTEERVAKLNAMKDALEESRRKLAALNPNKRPATVIARPGEKIQLSVKSVPAGLRVVLTTRGIFKSTTTYGPTLGSLEKNDGTTDFMTNFVASGNYGDVVVTAQVGPVSREFVFSLTGLYEEDVALAEIARWKATQATIDRTEEILISIAAVLGLIAAILAALAISFPALAAPAAYFALVAAIVVVDAETFKHGFSMANEQLRDQTIQAIQKLPEKDPVGRPPDDNTWEDY